ncbi:antibiotic biosynthesis monooxygenase family protein [Maribacter algicola]|uniref:Antibiotic biosynthesis monooxygenase family protein n=1 Tax=Meishania litoralis TaxID=3434685 RepID=A0ACC7LIG2_9FLAO
MNKPYYAVIFTSTRTEEDQGYSEMAVKMENLAKRQPGYLGFESAREEIGISISYWESLEAIASWKADTDHFFAQQKGIKDWYSWYKVRICLVEREYDFTKLPSEEGA